MPKRADEFFNPHTKLRGDYVHRKIDTLNLVTEQERIELQFRPAPYVLIFEKAAAIALDTVRGGSRCLSPTVLFV